MTNALGMATARRERAEGLVIDSDRGVQFTSWAFSRRVKDAGNTRRCHSVPGMLSFTEYEDLHATRQAA